MIKTVIFDMDGVIIDSEPIHQEIQQQLFDAYNISLSLQEYQAYIGRSSKNMWQELISRFSLDLSLEEVLKSDKEKYHQRLRNEKNLGPIHGVKPLIQQLFHQDVKLILASSSSRDSIDLVLDLFGLDPFFHHKISGAELTYSKPHPEIFLVAAGMIPCSPENCVVIEDSKHGIAAAKSAGMHCIGFRNTNSGFQDLARADLIIDNFNDLSYSVIMELSI